MAQKSVQERLEAMERKLAQQRARLQALKARSAMTERKRDTRRKILAGVLLIDGLHNDQTPPLVRQWIVNRINQAYPEGRNRELFEDLGVYENFQELKAVL